MNSIGVHVFAGGFSAGVKKVMPVEVQLERHGFGLDTAERGFGIPTINGDTWPDKKAEFIFGNPRCTGFSSVNFGCSESAHGPDSEPTKDAWEFMQYAIGRAPVFVWESVCGAYTHVGKPLIDKFVKMCTENDYRVAHVLVNALSFGNCQARKRYFFVGYRKGLKFNINAPDILGHKKTLWDVIGHLRDLPTNVAAPTSEEYNRDSVARLTPNELAAVPNLATGFCLNTMGEYACHLLPPELQLVYRTRLSGEPFSRHCIARLAWRTTCPVLTSSCQRLIHPHRNTGLTIGELSAIMGWGDVIPHGPKPAAQIAKGIVPAIGEWLAQQVVSCLNNEWGDDEWESSYVNNEWVGRDSSGMQEKVFDLRSYFHDTTIEPSHPDGLYVNRLNVAGNADVPTEPWDIFAAKSRRAGGSGGTRLNMVHGLKELHPVQ